MRTPRQAGRTINLPTDPVAGCAQVGECAPSNENLMPSPIAATAGIRKRCGADFLTVFAATETAMGRGERVLRAVSLVCLAERLLRQCDARFQPRHLRDRTPVGRSHANG
ncbi:hypothetical protein D9M69_688500 [compost metagenome]